MKLVEKKCPNCGAGLSFNENDKSCKCEYCKREFEVERKENSDGSSINFDLSELKTPLKIFSFVTLGHAILSIFAIILVIGLFFFVGMSIFKSVSKQLDGNSKFYDTIDKELDDENTLLSDISQLSNFELDRINNDANINISYSAKGVMDSKKSFYRDGEVKRQKIYLAYKDDENIIISIYKADYYNFFNQNQRFSIYVPILYRNVTKDVISTLDDEKIDAPEFYFDDERTTYFYGYSSLEEAIKEKIDPLRSDYKITEK